MKTKNEVGNKYGRLTVLSYAGAKPRDGAYWLCQCACGKTVVVRGRCLRRGQQSCGCLARENMASRMKLMVGENNPNWGKRGEGTSMWGRTGEKHPMWGRRREKSPKWTGGNHITRMGYVRILDHAHHRSDDRGYVFEHIVVMENMIDRPLASNEVVHHCNGDKSDNRPYNLRLFSSQGTHVAYHKRKLREVA